MQWGCSELGYPKWYSHQPCQLESIFVAEERDSMGVAGGKLTARIFHITVNKYLNSPNDRLFGLSILYREATRTGQVPFRDVFSFEPLPCFKSSLHSSLSFLFSIIVWHTLCLMLLFSFCLHGTMGSVHINKCNVDTHYTSYFPRCIAYTWDMLLPCLQ